MVLGLLLPMVAAAYEIPVQAHHPYVSTYYVQPTVSPDEETTVAYFVTDWENRKVRFGDDSLRFSARLQYSSDQTHWTVLTTNDLPSGDHVFNLGRLSVGDYQFGLSVTDEAGRSSHTVWHEFRSRVTETIPEARIWRVSEAELADYQLVPETNRYSFHLVDASQDALTNKTNSVAMVKAEMEAAAAAFVPKSGTYAIFAPAKDGKLMYRSWKQFAIVYADDYDAEAVEAEATRNTAALQRMFNNAATNGVVRVVLPRGVYRVSGYSAISIPKGLTVDLNGATIKMNGCTGSSGRIFSFTHVHDAHLVNGIVEGDYYEHDYEGSGHDSEWICGIVLEGDCRYCSLEDLTVRSITGYGVSNGTRAYDHTFAWPVNIYGSNRFSPGEINLADGTVDTSVTNRFTSVYRDISKLTNGYVMVSMYLGYQGIRTKSWYYLAAFYDADYNYLHGEVAFQYRNIPIPKGAKYLRITVDTASREDADKCELSAQHFKLPWNCAYKRLKIERCRCVGMAQSAMRNMLVEDCDFTYSGDTSAKCAYDAEDGWDMMQDVYLRRNVFHDNPNNELLTCAGHNFIIEDNVAKIHLYSRTMSPCVRNNTCPTARFECAGSRNRTMHGRYVNNRFGTILNFGVYNDDIGWDICMANEKIVSYIEGQELTIAMCRTGRLRDCTLDHIYTIDSYGTFDNLTFTNAHLVETRGANAFRNCRLQDCYLQHFNKTNSFTDCTLENTHLSCMSGGTLGMTNCVCRETWFEPSYWALPLTLDFVGCAVTNANKFFFRPAVYSIGAISAVDCDFDTGTSPVFDIFDLRAQETDVLTGAVSIVACTCSSGGLIHKNKSTATSTKRVSFESVCNRYGGAFVTPERFLDGVLPTWTRTVVPTPEGVVCPGEEVLLPSACRVARREDIADQLLIGLSESDIAAGLDLAYLKRCETNAVDGWAMHVGVNQSAVEAVTGPIGIDTSEGAEASFTTEDGGTVFSADVRTVQGLWYGFATSETLGSAAVFQPDVGSFQRADASGKLHLTSTPQTGEAGFYRVMVSSSLPKQ